MRHATYFLPCPVPSYASVRGSLFTFNIYKVNYTTYAENLKTVKKPHLTLGAVKLKLKYYFIKRCQTETNQWGGPLTIKEAIHIGTIRNTASTKTTSVMAD